MSIGFDVQKLEPGRRIRLIEVDTSMFGGGVMRFHNYEVPHTQDELLQYQANGVSEIPPKPIIWQGEEYDCWPYSLEGVELDGTGSSPTPVLSVANIEGTISSLCLALNDLVQAKVTVHVTFEHYLDGQPDADPEQEFVHKWYIDRKSNETGNMVSFELSSPADISGKMIPARQIHSVCHWMLIGGYRGPYCGYTGINYMTIDDIPTADPAQDECSGMLKACKYRFGENEELPFGGFVGSALQ